MRTVDRDRSSLQILLMFIQVLVKFFCMCIVQLIISIENVSLASQNLFLHKNFKIFYVQLLHFMTSCHISDLIFDLYIHHEFIQSF